jgi:hypothetical protein
MVGFVELAKWPCAHSTTQKHKCPGSSYATLYMPKINFTQNSFSKSLHARKSPMGKFDTNSQTNKQSKNVPHNKEIVYIVWNLSFCGNG